VSIDASLTYSLNGTGIAGKSLAFTFYIDSREGLNSEQEVIGVTDSSESLLSRFKRTRYGAPSTWWCASKRMTSDLRPRHRHQRKKRKC